MEIKVLHSKYESTKESQVLREILHQKMCFGLATKER